MALNKKEIALTVVGSIAGLTLTYLLWKQEHTGTVAQSQDASVNLAGTGSGGMLPFLPPIDVPPISATPSQTDQSNQGGNPVDNSGLDSMVAQLQAALAAALASGTSDTSTTSTTGNAGSSGSDQVLPPYIPPTQFQAPPVAANPPSTYSGGGTSIPTGQTFTPITNVTGTPAGLHPVSTSGVVGAPVNIPTTGVSFHITGLPSRN